MYISNGIDKLQKVYAINQFDEFDDGSEWTLSKCLTHANRTSNLIRNIIES